MLQSAHWPPAVSLTAVAPFLLLQLYAVLSHMPVSVAWRFVVGLLTAAVEFESAVVTSGFHLNFAFPRLLAAAAAHASVVLGVPVAAAAQCFCLLAAVVALVAVVLCIRFVSLSAAAGFESLYLWLLAAAVARVAAVLGVPFVYLAAAARFESLCLWLLAAAVAAVYVVLDELHVHAAELLTGYFELQVAAVIVEFAELAVRFLVYVHDSVASQCQLWALVPACYPVVPAAHSGCIGGSV